MMLLLLLTHLLFSLPIHATIIETAHIADVIPHIDKDTWFLVDLDNTLFEAKQALGHAHWFYDEMEQRYARGMTKEQAMEELYPDWVKIQRVCAVKPLEEDFVPTLLRLQEQNITIIGFTLRMPAVAETTLEQVASLGFDFSKTAPQGEFIVAAKHPTLYKQGIFFVCDYNRKGDVFMPFVHMVGHRPKKVVFIDDKRKNVEELELLLEKVGIDYVGVHYTAILQTEPLYDPEIAKFQYQFLDRIMSNQAAAHLINLGIEN